MLAKQANDPGPALAAASWKRIFVLKRTGEPVDLIHLADELGERRALVELQSGERIELPAHELGSAALPPGPRFSVQIGPR
jgi:hypothetical protein